jgi:predicted metal-dependent phosphoesterase TrpH
LFLELHCHSICSDGAEPAAEVGRRAAARDLALFVLTDHDTCAGSADAAEAAGPRAMRGVEVSCTEGKRTVHVLCYDVAGDARWDAVDSLLKELAQARKHRVEVIAAGLRVRFGIDLDVSAITATAAWRSVGRPDVAALLIAQGHASSKDHAFDRFLYDGGPGDPPHRRLAIAELLERVTAAGGRAALAHPHLYGDRGVGWLRTLRDRGLTGVEAYYGTYDPRERQRWLDVAKSLGLVACGGSDWHGPGTARDVGIELPDDAARPILAWLERG